MNTDPVTGITYQLSPSTAEDHGISRLSLLESVARTTLAHLQQGGYLTDTELPEVLALYTEHLIPSYPAHQLSRDFLIFLANLQSEKHAVTPEDEVRRMQKVLRARLRDHVHYWSLGPLPGRTQAFADHYPLLREACQLLLCPTLLSEEDSIIHIASLNPIAGIVLSAYVRDEIKATCPTEDEPFIFSFVLDYLSWETLQNRHFIV